MEGWIMGDIRTSQFGGIPFGNNASRPAGTIGQPYFNGEEKRLELYTSSGWQNIVSETPGVVSVSGNYLESVGSATFEVTGTNFTTGAIASVIGTNGVEINATSTTVNSIVSVSALFTGLVGANEPYDLKITNTSNLFGLLPDAIYINNILNWQTAAGSLGSFGEQVSVSVSAIAVDDSTLTYSLANGSALPSGLALNSATGLISGTLPDIATNTTYTFTINASDGSNPAVPRTFSISSNAAPVWVTPAGSLGIFSEQTSITLSAFSVTDSDATINYSLASGSSLPLGLSLSSSGVISGTLPDITSDTTYSFTVNASDLYNTVPRSFSITSGAIFNIEALAVGGGGGGGSQVGGGGGAGGLIYSGSHPVYKGSTKLVTIGTGGAGGPWQGSGSRPGSYGTNTTFGSWIAFGGGGGGAHGSGDPASGADGLITQSGRPGGSGGGGGANSSNGSGGSSTQDSPSGATGYGFNGGTGFVSSWAGGGGGGAGSVGANSTANTGGAGGAGKQYSITGTSLYYAGGGGGCGNGAASTGGIGGSGVGGDGKGNTNNTNTKIATDGATNTGSGGGGERDTGPGGDGASGVVIIAYPNTLPAITTIPGTLTYDQPTRSGYRVYRFTAGTGTITF
jgi:hypothetical protein